MDTNNDPSLVEMPSRSATSSIGKNSDVSLAFGIGGGGGDDEEVQSEYKGGALDCLNALEEVLPFNRSISKCYNGKSKSYANLSNVALCSTVEEITKPETAYTRKRKNLLAFTTYWDKNKGTASTDNNDVISKRTAYSRNVLSLEATNSSGSINGETLYFNSSSPDCCLFALSPQTRMPLQNEQSSDPSITGLLMNISKE